jgi:(p)ppGpp synthase/HD superfamily hydrolase
VSQHSSGIDEASFRLKHYGVYNQGWFGAALEFANKAHTGQKDKCGQPYINHPFRVAARVAALARFHGVETKPLVIAALLHDTIEDCGVTAETIEALFGAQVAHMVQNVTKPKGVNYLDWIRGVAEADCMTRLLKLADIGENLAPDRKHVGSEMMARKRYLPAIDILLARWRPVPSDLETWRYLLRRRFPQQKQAA